MPSFLTRVEAKSKSKSGSIGSNKSGRISSGFGQNDAIKLSLLAAKVVASIAGTPRLLSVSLFNKCTNDISGIIGGLIAIIIGVIVYKDKIKQKQSAAEKLKTGKNLEAGIHKSEKDGPNATKLDGESPPGYSGAVEVPPEKRGRGVSAWLQVTPAFSEPGPSTVGFICWFGWRKALT